MRSSLSRSSSAVALPLKPIQAFPRYACPMEKEPVSTSSLHALTILDYRNAAVVHVASVHLSSWFWQSSVAMCKFH